MMEWCDALAIGVEDIDRQHQAFIGLINQLGTPTHNGALASELRSILAEVVSYAEHHFIEEEAHMRRAGYPHLDEHSRLHDAAAAKIHDVLIRDADDGELSHFLGSFLKAWLIEHIMGEDKRFGEWLENERHDHTPSDEGSVSLAGRC